MHVNSCVSVVFRFGSLGTHKVYYCSWCVTSSESRVIAVAPFSAVYVFCCYFIGTFLWQIQAHHEHFFFKWPYLFDCHVIVACFFFSLSFRTLSRHFPPFIRIWYWAHSCARLTRNRFTLILLKNYHEVNGIILSI